jgi:hypothetical protein
MTGMADDLPNRRWYRLTPDRLIAGLLALEGLLLASGHFQWFAFNRHKGWTSLIAVAAVAAAIVLTFLWFIASFVFRHRFQFGIRSLLALTVAVAVPCSWMGVKMKEARRQAHVAAAIEIVGGWTYFRWQVDGDGNPFPNAQPPEPAWLRNLLSDDFFGRIVRVKMDTRSDPELEKLKVFDQLESLELSPATDATLEHLEGLNGLKRLAILGWRFTDAGIPHLKGLKKLRHLTISENSLTDADVEKLRQALPDCEIEIQPGMGAMGSGGWGSCPSFGSGVF